MTEERMRAAGQLVRALTGQGFHIGAWPGSLLVAAEGR
jgi:hypothetical protein